MDDNCPYCGAELEMMAKERRINPVLEAGARAAHAKITEGWTCDEHQSWESWRGITFIGLHKDDFPEMILAAWDAMVGEMTDEQACTLNRLGEFDTHGAAQFRQALKQLPRGE